MAKHPSSRGWARWWPVVLLLAAVLWPLDAEGDGDLPVRNSEVPKVLFVIERNESMADNTWDTLNSRTRWDVVVDAIVASINSAPTEMEFAIIGTSDNANQWSQISSFDHTNVHLVNGLQSASASISANYIASTYAYAIAEYLSLEDVDGDGWDRAPFRETCSTIDVIVIGDAMGDTDDEDPFSYPLDSNNYLGADNPVFDEWDGSSGDFYKTVHPEDEAYETLLDDVAYYAVNNDLNAIHDGEQTVRTHTILVDADTVNDNDVEQLFASTAVAGSGLFVRAARPEDVAVGISLMMTDLIRSLTGITSSFTSATGHRLFRGYTETWGFDEDDNRGVPLYRGHLQAFHLCNNPDGCDLDDDGTVDYDYGETITGPETDGSLWDAGQILASRIAETDGENSQEYSPDAADRHNVERTLWTNDTQDPSYEPMAMIPFDSTNVEDLGELMLPDWDPNHDNAIDAADCTSLRYDTNGDCWVDTDDAQEFIDFIRGVPEATFGLDFPLEPEEVDNVESPPLQLVREKGPWKMGGMFLAEPAFADSTPPIVTDDPAFYNFLLRLQALDPAIYVPSNAGWLHAFKVPFLDTDQDGWEDLTTDGNGGFELWGYMPRHLLDYESDYHEDFHRAIQLKLDGELYLHDGSVNLHYVWMDGIANMVDEDCDEADLDDAKDEDGCDYHRVLVVSLGMGSRYHYAIDVSDPWSPKFLWEWVGNTAGWRKGLSTGSPVIGEVWDEENDNFVPVVFWTGGARDIDGKTFPATNYMVDAKWYMVDLLYPENATFYNRGYQIPAEFSAYTSDSGRYSVQDPFGGVFGTPSAVDYDQDGTIDALYMGTRHGYVYKVLIDNGPLSRTTMEDYSGDDAHVCLFRAPANTPPADAYDDQVWWPEALSSGDTDAVFFRPSVARDSQGLIRVSWGTGWPGSLFEPYDNGNMFFMADGESAGDEWTCAAAEVVEACGGEELSAPYALSAGEKLVGPTLTYGGMVLFATYVTDNEDGAACGVGHTRIYAMNLDDCDGAFESGQDWGPESLPVTGSKYATVEGIPSRFSYSNDGMYLSITDADGNISTIGPVRPQPITAAGDRIFYANWRNVY